MNDKNAHTKNNNLFLPEFWDKLDDIVYLPGENIENYDIFGEKHDFGLYQPYLLNFFKQNEIYIKSYSEHILDWFESLLKKNIKPSEYTNNSILSDLTDIKSSDSEQLKKIKNDIIIFSEFIGLDESQFKKYIKKHHSKSYKTPEGECLAESMVITAIAKELVNNIYKVVLEKRDCDEIFNKLNSYDSNCVAIIALIYLFTPPSSYELDILEYLPRIFILMNEFRIKIEQILPSKEDAIKTGRKIKKRTTYIPQNDYIFYFLSDFGGNTKNAKNARTEFRNGYLMQWIKRKQENAKTETLTDLDLVVMFEKQFIKSKLHPETSAIIDGVFDKDVFCTKRESLKKLISRLRKKLVKNDL